MCVSHFPDTTDDSSVLGVPSTAPAACQLAAVVFIPSALAPAAEITQCLVIVPLVIACLMIVIVISLSLLKIFIARATLIYSERVGTDATQSFISPSSVSIWNTIALSALEISITLSLLATAHLPTSCTILRLTEMSSSR